MSLFHIFDDSIKQEIDTQPIILIDRSGSTSDHSLGKTILEREKEIIYQKFNTMNIESAYVIFWDSISLIPEEQPMSLENILNYKVNSQGSTLITQVLKNIPEKWYKDKKVSDIYIFTDGEIWDESEFAKILPQFSNHNIFINTIEPNNKNYLTGNCDAGNGIYRAIKRCNLTNKIKKFESYNEYHIEESFVSLENPYVPEDYLPYKSNIFKKEKLNDFFQLIEKELENKNEMEILKIAHELSNTLTYLTKNQKPSVKREMISLFSELFVDFDIYKDIRNIFQQEVESISKGQASTFQDYRRTRNKVFEKTQLGLFENVKENISNLYNLSYLSFITSTDKGDMIFKVSNDQVESTLTLDNRSFNKSSFQLSNYHIPILPLKVKLDNNDFDQSIRQWIRINYAKKYNRNVASDTILYLFLSDVLRVQLSDVSEEIKDSYCNLAKVMLDRKRYGTEIKEIDWLEANAPKTVTGYDDGINRILENCVKHLGLEKISPFTLWYGIILSIDKELGKKQLQFCVDDLIDDGIKPKDVLSKIREQLNGISYQDISNKPMYDYTCYITLDDTSKTGGYMIPPRKITDKVICAPKFVISEMGYEFLKENSIDGKFECPITHYPIEIKDLILVPPEEVLNEAHEINYQIEETIYDSNRCDIVNITEDMYSKEKSEEHKLKTIDECDFEKVAYKITSPYIQQTLGGYQIQIKSQEEFNNYVNEKYPFLKNIKLKEYGACLAGGFCRSILLKQRLKDLDFFLVGENHLENFHKLLKDSLSEIRKYYEEKEMKVKFLFMYKHQFNVFEVVVVSDPNDFFGEDYTLDNFKQYDFKSLHLFDQKTIIEPETGKVYRRRNKWSGKSEVDIKQMKDELESRDFSNYFEDGDVSGVRMKQRLQFVLTENRNISEIFENFDMYPCRVAWDGTTYFTNKSEMAYKYMINIVNEHNYSTLFDHRLNKYFTYGFSPVLPELDLSKIKYGLKLGENSFVIKQINDTCILSEIDSHLADKLQSIEQLEQKNAESGKSLYKSSLFCSLVSLLRYVKINEIAYKFTRDILIPDENKELSFSEKREKVEFIRKIDSRIEGHNYYGKYRKK